jgi:type VI secretion system protein ImpG
MEELLPYYERELGIFRSYSRKFAQRYPKTAGQLLIAGESSEDPHIERLIQSFALLTARISKRLDSDYPQFTESMLESLYPHYLRPLPSYSVVQMNIPGMAHGDTVSLLPRGTMLQSAPVSGVSCRFKTVYDVKQVPLAITKLGFSPFPDEPALDNRLPSGTTSAIKLTLAISEQFIDWRSKMPPCLRLFVNAEPSLRAALIDTLLMRTTGVFVQANGGAWTELASSPLRLAGLEDNDAMLPFSARSNTAFRLLTEYFSYPEKFNFVELDLAAIALALPSQCRCLTLYFALEDVSSDSNDARLLAALSPEHFLMGCTPVINLFDKAGVPFQQTHTSADYALLADATHASGYDIHTVNAVRLIRETASGKAMAEFAPLYTVGQGASAIDTDGCYWLTRRDEMVAAISPGHEMRMTLIDPRAMAGGAGTATVSTELTCTNRELPSQLQFGDPNGDLRSDAVPTTTNVRLLRKPTPPYRFANGSGTHWRLITHLTLNHATLVRAGVDDLRKMLSLYDLPQSAASRRQIRGIVAIDSGTVRAWMPTVPAASLMPGIGIRMTLDEQAFAGSSIVIFALVMERYFSLNRQINCFTQLEVISARSGKEIIKCKPRCNGEL